MSDERDLIMYYLRIIYSMENRRERIEDQNDSIASIKRAIDLNPVLTGDERDLLTWVYKSPVKVRRDAIQSCSADHVIEKLGREKHSEFIDTLRREQCEICEDLIHVVEHDLLPASTSPEQRVFYEKMKGDYYRYICETKEKGEAPFEKYCGLAERAYEDALKIAKEELESTSSAYLGLVLNYTVFLYETMDRQDDAISLAQTTHSETMDLVATDDAGYFTSPNREINDLLRYLKENCRQWIEKRGGSWGVGVG